MKKLFFAALVIFISCTKKEALPPATLLRVPNSSQLAWHSMELNAFVHFTVNTFTDKEWGYGDESEKVFNPTECNPEQWVSVLKKAGFRGLILTCKHHDGFCLWPSQYTEHSVKNSVWKKGKGDLVHEVAEACKQAGLKFGIYLSPWDRNHKDYGSPAYVEYYRNQLKELFTLYPDVFEMWFDGANGGDGFYGGKRETRKIDGRTYYDWPTTLNIVRGFDPSVIFFSDAGPGVRWVGNERGIAGETNWNTISSDTLFAGKGGIEKLLNEGSENGKQWIPAECDVSIRPGWFYHSSEDSLVKTPEQLFDIYLKSVGRGSLMLLNIPPDKKGLFHENDVKSLQGFRKLLDEEFKTNIAFHASARGGFRGEDQKYSTSNLTDGNDSTYWALDDEYTSGSFEIDFEKKVKVKYIVLQEFIKLGQRVKSFSVEVQKAGSWSKILEATTIGRKRILKLGPIEVDKIRVNILASRACPIISNVEVY
ncbi:MAG: alpha-L-fucosidase [Bacteroidetes bacterium]|nr:alpha-L-fucosidase [Bacteroidota bacterium]MBI3481368.1 alpha-L-fucosidase [Bacteroidota bacterium]